MKGKFSLFNKISAIVTSEAFEKTILFIILLNSIILGIQSVFHENSIEYKILSLVDKVCLGIFVLELILKITVLRKDFFKNPWNIFDTVIILISVILEVPEFLVFRYFRILSSLKLFRGIRTFRVITHTKELQKLIQSIGKALPSIMWTGLLLLVVFYAYALIGVSLFSKISPQYFESLPKTFCTLFQVMTQDAWADVIVKTIAPENQFIWVYFISFILITAFTIMSVVTGVIVDAITETSKKINEGKKKYVARGNQNHIVILGFNENVPFIVEQIALSNHDNKKTLRKFFSKTIVILGNQEIEEMKSRILPRIKKMKETEVIFRHGEIDSVEDINLCDVNNARSVAVMSSNESKTTGALLALNSILRKENNTQTYIAAVVNEEETARKLKDSFSGNSKIHIIHYANLVSRILAHASRDEGFGHIFTQLFSKDGNEIYIHKLPKKVIGKTFFDSQFVFTKATLIGLIENNRTLLNPPCNKIITEQDLGIFIARNNDEENFEISVFPEDLASLEKECTQIDGKIRPPHNILIIGYNNLLEDIMIELKDYLPDGSTIKILLRDRNKKSLENLMKKIDKEIPNVKIESKVVNYSTRENIQSFLTEEIDTVIELLDVFEDDFKSDSKVLLNLMMCSNIREEKNLKFRLLCQLKNIQSQNLAPEIDGVEFVVGSKITSQILAQVLQSESHIYIFDELLKSEGSEFYMRDVCEYINVNEEISLQGAVYAAAKKGEVFIGYYDSSGKGMNKVVLNPEKKTGGKHTFVNGDKFIVLAKN